MSEPKQTKRIRLELEINQDTGETVLILSAPDDAGVASWRISYASEEEARAGVRQIIEAAPTELPSYSHRVDTEDGKRWIGGENKAHPESIQPRPSNE